MIDAENKVKVVDLKLFIENLYEQRALIYSFMILSLLIGLTYSIMTPNLYRSSVLLYPTLEENSTGMSAIAGKLSGLAALSGFGFNSSNQNTEKSIAILKSKQFILSFINQNDLKKKIFYEKWDDVHGEWESPGMLKKALHEFKGVFGGVGELSSEPSDLDAYRLFLNDHFEVYEDKKVGLITLRVTAYNSNDSAEWAEEIVKKINEYIRQRDKQEAEDSIKFLENEIRKTNVVSVKQSLFELVQVNLKTMMMANVRSEYAFEIIDKPMIPDRKYWPNRTLICVFSIFLGAMVGVLIAFYKSE